MSKKDFVRGNERLDRMLAAVPAEEIEQFETEAAELDRIHAMTLTMVREAGKHTQVELARELHTTQGHVSQIERRDDMLLSTLRNYLTATGAQNPRIVVTVNGHDVELNI